MSYNALNINPNYYPYGMLMPGRESGSHYYRYGFQGQERDEEIKGYGNSLNYKYRMHDPRLGRFFAVDPLTAKYPHNGPYNFSENRVIDGVELEGAEYIRADFVLNAETGETVADVVPASKVTYELDGVLYYRVGFNLWNTPEGGVTTTPGATSDMVTRFSLDYTNAEVDALVATVYREGWGTEMRQAFNYVYSNNASHYTNAGWSVERMLKMKSSAYNLRHLQTKAAMDLWGHEGWSDQESTEFLANNPSFVEDVNNLRMHMTFTVWGDGIGLYTNFRGQGYWGDFNIDGPTSADAEAYVWRRKVRAYYWLQEANPNLPRYVEKFRPSYTKATSFIWNMDAIELYFREHPELDVENVPLYNVSTDSKQE